MNRETEARLERVAIDWWRELQPRPDGSGGNRGALARLRRAATPNEAAVEPAAMDLCRRLGLGPNGLGTAAVAASVLAHVREDRPGLPFARVLGQGAMSALRFRRLVQATSDEDRLPAFRRAVALSGGVANIADLAASMIDWNDPRRRQRWLYAYYDASVPDSVAPEPAAELAESAA